MPAAGQVQSARRHAASGMWLLGTGTWCGHAGACLARPWAWSACLWPCRTRAGETLFAVAEEGKWAHGCTGAYNADAASASWHSFSHRRRACALLLLPSAAAAPHSSHPAPSLYCLDIPAHHLSLLQALPPFAPRLTVACLE